MDAVLRRTAFFVSNSLYLNEMTLRTFFLKVGLIDLTVDEMKKMMDASNSEMIVWAFRNGRYDVRKLAVDYFSMNPSRATVPLLENAMYDETELVSQAAMNALEAHPHSTALAQKIAAQRSYWSSENDYREERRNRAHKKQSVLTESKERGSKRTLDNVRNMLKKPINGGKWF